MLRLRIRKVSLFALLSFSFSIIQSCNPCATLTCNNGGVCADGSCICAAGYEGPNCNTESRNKFLGNYEVHSAQSDPSGPITLPIYTCEITAGNNPNEIIITQLNTGGNVPGVSDIIVCNVNGNEFEISHANSSLIIGTSNNYNANGSASIPKFSMYYRNEPPPGTAAEAIAINADFYPL